MNIKEYLSNFFKGTKNPSLSAMQFFMKRYGNPEKKLKVIHIAGTNGKGSCTEMMTNILINCGYKVGKFMSPHLIDYNERICINNEKISDFEMEELINELNPLIEEYNQNSETNVTLFELETTMAILYFYRNNCDFVVLEVGLGGLYDCTNIANAEISIINSISYDHMHILGNSLKEIAKQKAGIIKENAHTVFIEQETEVNDVIINTCKEKNNTLHMIKTQDIKNHTYNQKYQKFDYKQLKDILINLKGEKQIYNASLCIEAINIIKENYNIPEDKLRQGLKTVIHRARFEEISEKPKIIFDGAHNEASIQNLKKSVNMYFHNNKKIFVVSILKTKDYRTILTNLIDNKEDMYIFTSGNNKDRFVSKEDLYNYTKDMGVNENIYKMELDQVFKMIEKQYIEYTTFIIGSFYIYDTVINLLKSRIDIF